MRFYRHCGKGWEESESNTQAADSSNVIQNVTYIKENTLTAEKDITERIIEIIRTDKKATRKSIAEKLSLTVRHVQRILNSMPNVHYEGSSKSGHWVVTDENKEE